MGAFTADWLSLRKEADDRARHKAVINELIAWLSEQDTSDRPLVLADIGSGTGATVRAFDVFGASHIRWHLFDHDDALLGRAAGRFGAARVVGAHAIDLASDIEPVFAVAPRAVTASALLDLVSEHWIAALAGRVAAAAVPFYAALSYDGRMAFNPVHGYDARVCAAVNHHQEGDKGFGPALGPKAAEAAIAVFRSRGYRVVEGCSDWQLSNEDAALQSALIEGWREAALETRRLSTQELDAWAQYRLGAVADGVSRITVGHVDFCALPKNRTEA